MLMVNCPNDDQNVMFAPCRLRRTATCPKSQHIETMPCPDWRTRQFAAKPELSRLAANWDNPSSGLPACLDPRQRFNTSTLPLVCRTWRKKGRNCETNPISFKTYYLPNTNNEIISLLAKSKSYDPKRRAPAVRLLQRA